MVKIERFESCMQEARDLIKKGEVVGVPTDTVYGLVCDACNLEAVSRLYALKKRPREKALQAVFASISSIKPSNLFLPSPLDELAKKFLPGALCPIALAAPNCPLSTLKEEGGEKTQAIRVPNLPPLLMLASLCGPLACSSANISSRPESCTAKEAAMEFGGSVPLYASLEGGARPGGGERPLPSTVLRASQGARGGVEILREGEISSKKIYQFLSNI